MFLPFIQTFFALFGIIDPVGNAPIFLTLTDGMPESERRSLAMRAVARAGVILLIFLFLGTAVLDIFNVSIESFRIAGGLILIVIGLQIVFDLDLGGRRKPDDTSNDLSVVPLASPLIAGPGAITAAIIFSKEFGYLPTLVGILLNLLLTLIAFRYGHIALRLLGKKGVLVFARVMGLILVSLGVEFIRAAF